MRSAVLRACVIGSFYFSAVVVGISLVLAALAVQRGQAGWLALAVLNLYLTPLVSYRVFHYFYPIREGFQTLWPMTAADPPTWIVGHKIQLVYHAFPMLEHALVLVPGLYAAWLRLWGSKVGKDTFFTPQIEASDRGLVEIGDECFFGHRVFMASHMVIKKDGRYVLFVRRIRIGAGSFVGAVSHFGPGTSIPAGTFVPLASFTTLNQKLPRSLLP
jgi:hypothetical protein